MDNAVFADFRLVQELGRGSFGTVYKAKWKGANSSGGIMGTDGAKVFHFLLIYRVVRE